MMALATELVADPASSIDHLAERVERAAGVVLRLKEQNARLQELLREAERRSAALEAQLVEKSDVENNAEYRRMREQEEKWRAEKRSLAERIDGLVQRLEQLGA
jgi:predicted  nucleic acid-binding Zn-ribbon protein